MPSVHCEFRKDSPSDIAPDIRAWPFPWSRTGANHVPPRALQLASEKRVLNGENHPLQTDESARRSFPESAVAVLPADRMRVTCRVSLLRKISTLSPMCDRRNASTALKALSDCLASA